jgi:hypothetical protein
MWTLLLGLLDRLSAHADEGDLAAMRRLMFILLLLGLVRHDVFADTGLLRQVVRTDDAHVLVFTAPASLRAGVSEVVVVVNDPSTGEPIVDVEILVKARMIEWDSGRPSMIYATIDDDGLRMARKAMVDLQREGDWVLEVAVILQGQPPLVIPIEVFVAPAMSSLLSYGPVLLFWLPCVLLVLLRDRILHGRLVPQPV